MFWISEIFKFQTFINFSRGDRCPKAFLLCQWHHDPDTNYDRDDAGNDTMS